MTVFGYLDPGTGTLIVQAVLGGAAGVAVLFKTKGRRLFKRGSAEPEGSGPTEMGLPTDDAEEPIATGPSD